MWNRSKARLWTNLLPSFTPLYLAFLLYHLTSTVADGSPSPYTPVDMILVACGSSGNSTSLDGRIWIGDVSSKFSPIDHSQNQTSFGASSDPSSSAAQTPYITARVSLSEFTYTFPVNASQKFIRLHFNPASYRKFDRSKPQFSVKAGSFTLLDNFSPSLTEDTILREYMISIVDDQMLNITFTPSVSNSHAFINGIEILSMPPYLYYTSSDDDGILFVGPESLYRIENNIAMETLYRVNVGGRSILPSEDTGMFRGWSQDDDYFSAVHKNSAILSNSTIELKFTKVPPYSAPEDVYRTARTMGNDSIINKNYNLTWEFSVDSGFIYLVRLHFCEIQPEITQQLQRQFIVFIANMTAGSVANLIQWSGGNGVPILLDFVVSMFVKESEKKMNLSVALERKWITSYNDPILNGVEIIKQGTPFYGIVPKSKNDTTIIAPAPALTKSKNNRTTIIGAVGGGGLFGFVVLSILGFFILRRRKRNKDSSSMYKSTKTRRSSLPSDQCRHFSLATIKAATHSFDEALIIGVGGFGNVYKGDINIEGGANLVAIKRLTPDSHQGAHEFETEIEMLSQLRHRHLVSLIGYCNDGNEMILVYDFMACGTLRDHLHKTTDNPPLCWKQRLEICIGAARGLNYLHTGTNHTIIHRDVKTTNILLDEKLVAKVSDFGLSKIGKSEAFVSTNVKGTFGYLDPEYYRRRQLSQKSDVYSFGVVLFEVLSAKPPIINMGEMQEVCLGEWAPKCYYNGEVDQIVDPSLKGEIAAECLKTFAEIAVNCLQDSGINRPSMNDVVRDLELALQLQESADKDARLEKEVVQPNDMCSSSTISAGQDFSEIVNLQGR